MAVGAEGWRAPPHRIVDCVAGRPIHNFQVVSTEKLTRHVVRVVLGGRGFDTFSPIDYTDAYVKILFIDGHFDVAALPQPLTLDSFSELPRESQPVVRTYTVRRVCRESRQITIDFVTHGDQGVAGPWALAARPGDEVRLMGPSGAYAPRDAADWHLFAGDEAGLPAISAALESLPHDAVGRAFIEVAGAEDEIALDAPAGITVEWIHRGGRADLVGGDLAGDNAPLVAAVRSDPWLPGQAQVFIHGEAQAVMHNLRPYIRRERGVAAEWTSISGYWRRGRTEESFRQWKKDLAAAEAIRAE